MKAVRFSDEFVPEGSAEFQERVECAKDFFCYKGFPWERVAREFNPAFWSEYDRLENNPYDISIIRNSPLLQNRQATDQQVQGMFDYVQREMENEQLLRSAVGGIFLGITGGAPGLLGDAITFGGAVAGPIIGKSEARTGTDSLNEEKKRIQKHLDAYSESRRQAVEVEQSAKEIQSLNESGQLKTELQKVYQNASSEDQKKLKDAIEKLGGATLKLNDLAIKEGKRNVENLRLQSLKQAKELKSTGTPDIKDIWKGYAQFERMDFEVGRNVIPPDQFYELAKAGKIPLPQDVKLETLESAATAYKQTQEYKEIQTTVRQVQQFGQEFLGIATKLGMDPKMAETVNKGMSIAGSVVMAFCPPSPVNIAFSVLGIVGTLLSGGGNDGMQQAIAQIVELQKEILIQVRLLRIEMEQNQEELLATLEKAYASLRYDTIHIRSVLTDEVERNVFGECTALRQRVKLWQEENAAKPKSVTEISDFLESLDADQRKSIVHCLGQIETLVVMHEEGSIHSYFCSKTSLATPGANIEERRNYAPTESEAAQNHFDFLTAYYNKYGSGYTPTDKRLLALPARTYDELKRKFNSNNALPIAYSKELFKNEAFNVLMVPGSLVTLSAEENFLSSIASNIDAQGSVIRNDKVRNLVSEKAEIGITKRVYLLLQRTRDLLALARAQQNLMNGDVLLPVVWKNLNIGLASLHIQRITDPKTLGVLSSQNYRDAMRLLDENPLFASNVIAWGIWDLSRPGQSARHESLDLEQAYEESYEDSTPNRLLGFFLQFVTNGSAISAEEQDRLHLKGRIPDTIAAWGEANIKFICWTDARIMSRISSITAKLDAINHLDQVSPTRDLRNPSKILNREEEGRRTKERAALNQELKTLNELLRNPHPCENPPESNDHKWFVQFPEGNQFIALPLPSKILKREIYSSLAAQKIYRLSEELEANLFDYEWEYWKDRYSAN